MLYAKVVFGLAIDGPFDYLVPALLAGRIKPGSRVWVDFCHRRSLGYVVDLSHKSSIKKVKPILSLPDSQPILDQNLLLLTRKLSEYYCSSWGQLIETGIPEALRKGGKLDEFSPLASNKVQAGDNSTILLHDLRGSRWDEYLQYIKDTLSGGLSAIVILPDKDSMLSAAKIIGNIEGASMSVLHRDSPKEAEEWVKIREGKVNVVIGARSAVFAPLSNLGLMIIDGEEDTVYKQDQVPHYHARRAAFMRQAQEKFRLILGSPAPSIESFYLVKRNKIKYELMPPKDAAIEVKTVDLQTEYRIRRREKFILSRYLQDAVYSTLGSGGKVLLFLDRKGFATSASCNTCGARLLCPRCNINLTYHFKEDRLSCHYCNFKMPLPKICPQCNAGYIKFSGKGTERIESELARAFPQARIRRLDGRERPEREGADIFIATSSVIRHPGFGFELVGVLGVDNSLNRPQLRASERAYAALSGLLLLTKKTMVVETSLRSHHSIRALVARDPSIFYSEELRQRKELGFPPFSHLALVKLRGKDEERVAKLAQALFDRFKQAKKSKGIKLLSVNRSLPSKLRGNFYWQILLSCGSADKLSAYLKINLKDFAHSGIIITVDVDPV